MSTVRELAEALWRGDVSTTEVHPVAARFPEGEEIEPGLLYYKGIAGATTVDTGEGLVLLDTGAVNDRRPLREAVRRWRPDVPVRAAVYSHHHVDHVMGITAFDEEAAENRWPRPVVYGHELIPAHFRRYVRTRGWNTAINVRQFSLPPDRFQWPSEYREPDVTYRDALLLRCGELTFELRHARGETDDATWTWIPERKLLAPGDLFIWAVPNAGNPQKVQRYCGEWAVALRAMAALGAETMIPGHGLPIFGRDRIRQALTETAELLETIEAQVIELMNLGATLDRVLREVRLPEHLLERPYLRPVYDHPEFLIRNVWRLYGGWYDGEPDNLLPAPRRGQAREWVRLAGGVERVLQRAQELLAANELRLASHLVEFAVLAEPRSQDAHRLRAAVYRARASAAVSSMERNLFDHAARSSDQGVRDFLAPEPDEDR